MPGASESAEEVLWEARPRPRPLQASDWVFYAQYVLILIVIALILPDRVFQIGFLRAWRFTIPLFALAGIGFHLVHLRSRHLSMTADTLLVRQGVFWSRTERLVCPDPRVHKRAKGGWELRGSDGSRHELQGLNALQIGALRAALGDPASEEELAEESGSGVPS